MSARLLRISLLLVAPLAALAFFLGAYFFFYRGGYDSPPAVTVPFDRVSSPLSSHVSFTDAAELHSGMLLVDGAHLNDFTRGEVSYLLDRVASRGFDVEFTGPVATLYSVQQVPSEERLALLREGLRRADSLLVIAPVEAYTRGEVDLVERFVEKGGRLLLIADPTRAADINSLAERFGVTFQPGYLYNNVDYDLNFRNIFVRNFRPDEVTRGLRQIALYTAGSIKSARPWLAHTDANTRSSIVERVEPFYPIVRGENGRVLAIHDLTFMVPPQNSILDNDQLISNIAGYLTAGQRSFDLADFPYFLRGDVDILLGRSSLFDAGAAMKAALGGLQVSSNIVGVEDITRSTIYLGLYQDAPGVAQYLEIAGVRVDGALRTPFTPDIDPEDTAFILLHETQDRRVLAVLGATEEAVAEMLRRLGDGSFRTGLVSDSIGVYRIR